MSTARYRQAAGSVSNVTDHLVWCLKYRRPVLTVIPDHVHLVVAAPPTHASHHRANHFTGATAWVLRQEFPPLRSRLPSRWSRRYDIGAAGTVSAETIRRSIDAQKGP